MCLYHGKALADDAHRDHCARAAKRVLRRQQACAADASHALRPLMLQMSQEEFAPGKIITLGRGQGALRRFFISLMADCTERAPNCSPSSRASRIASSIAASLSQ